MMADTAPDLSTFAKVRALHDSTTHAAERASAKARMTVLARKAGMTVEQAVSRLDAPPPPPSSNFFDSPFFRETLAERERERVMRWREVLEEYGTEEAVFEPGPMERALDDAAESFGPHPGWDAYPLSAVPPEIVATVEAAWPMPDTVRAAWVEFTFWEKLSRDREARGVVCGDRSAPVQIRNYMLERMLDEAPALSLNDLRARMSWLEHRDEIDNGENGTRFTTLRADIERMGARLREQDATPVQSGRHVVQERHPMPDIKGGNETLPPSDGQGCADHAHPSPVEEFCGQVVKPPPSSAVVQSGQSEGYADCAYPSRRTNADKRRDVLALLIIGKSDNDPSATPLTDREIARRAGVSPTTVGTIRRSLA